MGRHALRGAFTAWLTLVVLRTVGTAGGSSKVAGVFADADRLISRALSPDVPAIPDRRTGAGKQLPTSYITPAQAKAGAAAAAGSAAVTSVTSPGGLLGNLGSLDQYINGGGLSGLADNPALK